AQIHAAGAGDTNVPGRATVAGVAACRAVCDGRVRAGAVGGVAVAGRVALVGRGARDGIAAVAIAGVTGGGWRARVAVVAGRAVVEVDERARAVGRIAGRVRPARAAVADRRALRDARDPARTEHLELVDVRAVAVDGQLHVARAQRRERH